jgi:hypothetical protein
MYVVQAWRQWKSKVRTHRGKLGKAPVYRIASESGFVAQVFHPMMAVPAITVYTAHPGDADTRSQRQLRCCAFDHLPNDLMSWNEFRPNLRQISFNDV